MKQVDFRIWAPIWPEAVEANVVCVVTNIGESKFLKHVCSSLGQNVIAFRAKLSELNVSLYG
jgi:hypothetical protein